METVNYCTYKYCRPITFFYYLCDNTEQIYILKTTITYIIPSKKYKIHRKKLLIK